MKSNNANSSPHRAHAQSSSFTVKDNRGVPIVKPSPSRSSSSSALNKSKLIRTVYKEPGDQDDEIQLCKLPINSSPVTNSTAAQRGSYVDYFARASYTRSHMASSPSLRSDDNDIWQDALTEPLTPSTQPIENLILTSTRRATQKYPFSSFSHNRNPIEAPRNISLSRSKNKNPVSAPPTTNLGFPPPPQVTREADQEVEVESNVSSPKTNRTVEPVEMAPSPTYKKRKVEKAEEVGSSHNTKIKVKSEKAPATLVVDPFAELANAARFPDAQDLADPLLSSLKTTNKGGPPPPPPQANRTYKFMNSQESVKSSQESENSSQKNLFYERPFLNAFCKPSTAKRKLRSVDTQLPTPTLQRRTTAEAPEEATRQPPASTRRPPVALTEIEFLSVKSEPDDVLTVEQFETQAQVNNTHRDPPEEKHKTQKDPTEAVAEHKTQKDPTEAIAGAKKTEKDPTETASEVDKPPPPSSSSSSVNKKLTKEEEATKVAEEIDYLMKTVKNLSNYYELVDKIGEGTFSTVYKALDIRRDLYDNEGWESQLLSSQSQAKDKHAKDTQAEDDRAENDQARSSNQYVALKRIYDTSSPERIAKEIQILRKLTGSPCISPLITAFRQQNQVFVVMPYIEHDDFKSNFFNFSMNDIKCYMRSLLSALQDLHKHRILHRDVKPHNFLYSIRRKTGYLIDFGLAETEQEGEALERFNAKLGAKMQNNVFHKSSREAAISGLASSSSVLAALTNKENRASSSQAETTATATGALPSSTPAAIGLSSNNNGRTMGYVKNDARYQVRANRAGTKGFRAPEILMRVPRQTCAIDIWAAGVIFLSLLSGRHPFFLGNDEADSLVELCHMFGSKEIQKCAEANNRTFFTNIPCPTNKIPWHKVCNYLNKNKIKEWDVRDYQEGLDLLEGCLDLNTQTRMTASEALQHPFLLLNDS